MKKKFVRISALLLTVIMVISLFPAISFATDDGESATLMNGLPADQSWGVIYNADGYVMCFDLDNGKAPAKAVSLNSDGSMVESLPNGTAVIKFIQTGSDYYLTLGGKYLTVKDLSDSEKEKLVLTDVIETGSKWTIITDKANAAGYYNILNAEFKWNGTQDVYLEQYTNAGGVSTFSPYSYKSSVPTLFQMKFYATSADEDGREGETPVGETPVAGGLPENGTYVVYCAEAEAVFGQPTGADVAAPALLAAAAEVKNDAIAYEDVADGGMIFTVEKNGDVYTFENNGLFLAMPENTVDESGRIINDETLLMIEWPEEADKQGFAQWRLVEIAGGYRMDNVNARYGGSKCCIEYFNGIFSGWTYKAAIPELFAMNFYPMEDKDGTGYVVNPEVIFNSVNPTIGEDCVVQFTINDVSDPIIVTAFYETDDNLAKVAEVTMEGHNGSVIVPIADLENATHLTITVTVTDQLGRTYSGIYNTVIDHIHDWNEPTYVWSEDNSEVTATRVCKKDASHIETETVQTTITFTAPASCLEPGETIYVAIFENPAFSRQEKTVIIQDALGHDWDEPTYVWSEDNCEATASRICLRDGTHNETEAVQTTSEITKHASCLEMGETTYTAVFENPAFTQQVKVLTDIPALGHDLTTIPAVVPTCTQTGLSEGYYCTRCDYVIPQETVDALGHDYLNGICSRCGAADPFYENALLEISLLSLYARQSHSVVIPVTITGGADIAGFTLTVSADPGLNLTRVQKGEMLQGAEGSLVSNLSKGIINWTSTEEVPAEGELLLLTFTADETAEMYKSLNIQLRLKDDKPTNMANAEGEAVSVRFADGVLIVVPVLFGDTNSDEEINSADAVRLVRSIVELEELSDTEFLAADVSHDDDVTSADSIILTRYLAGLVDRLDLIPIGNRRARQNAEETAAVQVGTVVGNPGDTVTVPVTISGNTGFAGFTWEIACSDALNITKITKGELLTQSDGGSLTTNLEKGLVNWNDCYNLDGDGTVLLLTVHIDENAKPGVHTISISLRNGSAGNFVDEHGIPVSAEYQAGSVMIGCPFEDVQAGAYYLDAVLWAYSHEPQITSGTSDTMFSPNQACTRGQIVTFLWHAAGNLAPTISESPFNDVQNSNAYYYDAVLWAYENEVTNGVSTSSFGVNRPCTRAQVVTFLWRLAGSPEPTRTETGFTDVPTDTWYTDAVRWAVENDITAGTSPTTFSPNQTCTRAQVVTFLYKYYTGNDTEE